MGSNAGNLVFLQATWKILGVPGARITADRLLMQPGRAGDVNERYDIYVIPLANAFRLSFEPQLIQMTQLIRRLRIPVVVLGVGAESDTRYDLARLEARRARGPGLRVGGPRPGPVHRGARRADGDVPAQPGLPGRGRDRLSLHVPVGRAAARRQAAPRASVQTLASPSTSRRMSRRWARSFSPTSHDIATYVRTPGPRHARHAAVGRAGRRDGRRGQSDPDASPHPSSGRIASASTSSHGRGSRTCASRTSVRDADPRQHRGAPRRDARVCLGSRLPDARARPVLRHPAPHDGPSPPPDVDAAALYDESDFDALNTGHAARFATLRDFLHRHGLAEVFTDGDGGRSFDERIIATAFPGAVRTSTTSDASSLRARKQQARYRVYRAVRSPSIRSARTALLRRLSGLSDDPGSATDRSGRALGTMDGRACPAPVLGRQPASPRSS